MNSFTAFRSGITETITTWSRYSTDASSCVGIDGGVPRHSPGAPSLAEYRARPGARVGWPDTRERLDRHPHRFGGDSVSCLFTRRSEGQEALRASYSHRLCVSAIGNSYRVVGSRRACRGCREDAGHYPFHYAGPCFVAGCGGALVFPRTRNRPTNTGMDSSVQPEPASSSSRAAVCTVVFAGVQDGESALALALLHALDSGLRDR
jgi:hypothetical protein